MSWDAFKSLLTGYAAAVALAVPVMIATDMALWLAALTVWVLGAVLTLALAFGRVARERRRDRQAEKRASAADPAFPEQAPRNG